MGLLQRGQRLLNRALADAHGRPVVYARKLEAATLTAWPGRTQAVTDPRSQTPQVTVDVGERDYLIPVAELRRAGFDEPRKGDRITEVIGGDEVTFEVTPADGQPAWKWDEQDRTRYRVTTKRRP